MRKRRAVPYGAAGQNRTLPLDEIGLTSAATWVGESRSRTSQAWPACPCFNSCTRFVASPRLTPYGLVLDLRVEHAKSLLARGKSIADAAYGAGFSDQSHLTRHFRRRTGITPKQYLAVSRAAA